MAADRTIMEMGEVTSIPPNRYYVPLVDKLETDPDFKNKRVLAEKLGSAGTGTVSDASTTTKGVSKLSVAPADPDNPIALGPNDPKVAKIHDQNTDTGTNQAAWQVGQGAIGAVRTIEAVGTAADIALSLKPKGAGKVKMEGAAYVVAAEKVLTMNTAGEVTPGPDLSTFVTSTTPLGSVLFVSPNGNNASAIKGRIDKPYLTIQAALNAVTVASDIVYVWPGTYTENPTSLVSSAFFGAILNGCTINGNVNVNNNTGANRLILTNGATINGDIAGTFGCPVRGDRSGVINGRWAGTNGALDVDGLYEWKYSGTDVMFASYFSINNVAKITQTGTGLFIYTAASGTLRIHNVDILSTTSNLIQNFSGGGITVTGGLQNIRKCSVKSLYSGASGRPLTLDYLDRVNLYVTNASICGGNVTIKTVTDCEFINAHATEPVLDFNSSVLKFYNCKFQSTGGGAFIKNYVTTSEIAFINFVTNQSALITNVQPATPITNNVFTYANLNLIR